MLLLLRINKGLAMLKIAASILLVFLFSSCSDRDNIANNKAFLQKYGKEVDRINQDRDTFTKEQKPPSIIKNKSSWKSLTDILGVSGTNKYKSAAYADTSNSELFPSSEEP